MKAYTRIFYGVLILSMMMCCFMGCGSAQSKNDINAGSIKIGYLPITHAIPLYVEKNEEKADIELVKFGSWPELMEALNSGKIDGASVLIELAMKAKSQGINLKAVALGHTDGNAVVVSEDINTVYDLKGKSFAIPNKLSTHNILVYQMLKEAGMTMSDINIVELAPAEMAVSLEEGRISGYCVAEPFGAKSVVNGRGHVLKQSGDIIQNSICCALVFRDEFINEDRENALKVIKSYKDSCEYITNHDEETKEYSKSMFKINEKVLELSLGWIDFEKLKIQKDDYEKICSYLNEMNLMSDAVSYEDFVDNSLLEEVE